ncbi:unnamed protein product [Paramecium sonneborni]|uniref:WD domain, G-beta repeat protein n=1 Tax=Paramecium sonneborni TaxID=65129 RepID=A0A8S1RJP6_9CILI|nr:unnamed protein product [Paramecium sonneborni]
MQVKCIQADHINQQIIGICIDNNCQYQRAFCVFCLPNHGQHLNNFIPIEGFDEWIQQQILILNLNDVQKNVQDCKLVLDRLIAKFIPYFNINVEQLGITQIDNIIKSLCQIKVYQQQLFNQLKQSIQQVKLIVDEILKNNKTQIKQRINQFELMNQNIINQVESCKAISFNKDCSIMIAGCKEKIKIFLHQEGMLNSIQMLSEHTKEVFTLNFMRNNNNFVSGSVDQSIIIWQVNEINYQWNCQQKLNGHQNWILCLLINNNDDLIISGGCDRTIKFWGNQNQWLCQQTIINHTSNVCSLSLNENQNKLISCSDDQQILVMEQAQLDKKWNVIQQIKVDQYGFRLCFIDDNLFTFQPKCKDQMHVYKLDSNTHNYRKTKEIVVRCGSDRCSRLFPQQYLKSKCLLVNKNGNNINIMTKKENDDFVVEQSIEFSDESIYGQLSDNGEYLITWDSGSKEIQVRKCKENLR